MTQQPSKWPRPSPTIRVGVLGLFAAFLLVLPLALAPRAAAYIYWTNLDTQTMGRAKLNGTGVEPGFLDVTRGPMTVDARRIYWVSGKKSDKVARARIDGTGIDRNYITGFVPLYCARVCSGIVNDLAVGAGHIYGAGYGTGSYTIVRANLDGTGIDHNFIRTTTFAVAVDAGHVYWLSFDGGVYPNSIGRANLDGTGVDEHFISGLGSAVDLAVGAGHVYWTTVRHTIGRANLDGTGVDQNFIATTSQGPFVPQLPNQAVVQGLAVDDNHIYWTSDYYEGTIGRANLDGTDVDFQFLSVDYPVDVAVNALRPVGKVTADRTQRQKGNKIRVKVRVKAKDRLTVKASGKIKVNPTYKLRPKRVQVAAGKTKTLRLKPKKAKADKIAAALKRGEKAKARLTVKLTDLAGNRETEKLRVSLKR